MISQETRDHYDAGGFLAANYGKQQQQDKYITFDFEILGGSDSIEIPQTQYLLNQTSHKNNVTTETAHVQNSLPDFNSKRLKFEVDKTPSGLLFDGELRNVISEQHDSGIRAVTSSESASLYDVSPEEKGTVATENQQEGHCLDDEDALENASCSCLNLSSPKRKKLPTSDSLQTDKHEDSRIVGSLDRGARPACKQRSEHDGTHSADIVKF
ncbi:hypothetical protein K0M31_011078 [Melipona bicolor]|uniref:Uncharacterized protein n=1 Tax=Melipona bicolor TaxID=60889 RepID=A0AA40FL65_9HYME|nr:hypothetical protein K0M31_011078 [Melipona bicolor]